MEFIDWTNNLFIILFKVQLFIFKKKKYIIKIIYLIKKRRLTIIRIQLFILILNVNIKNNEEDFINDEKYLNKNNHLS
jgi:hypothetical protein